LNAEGAKVSQRAQKEYQKEKRKEKEKNKEENSINCHDIDSAASSIFQVLF
jgi:hypothetical protein